MRLFDEKIFLLDAEFSLNNASLISRFILSFAAALIYSEIPAADKSEGQTKSSDEFTVKETNQTVIIHLSLILNFAIQLVAHLTTETIYSSCAM